jgi:putative membrane protein
MRHLLRGLVAGATGGFVASWIMSEFMTEPGQKLQQVLQGEGQNRLEQKRSNEPNEDATMKAADAVVSTVTGGEHLSWEGKQKAGAVVHYAFGSLMGALYGAAVEYWPAARANFGTTFGTALFTGADLMTVPTLKLGPSPDEQLKSKLVNPLAAHIVYGATTELVRRLVRRALE